MHGIKREELKAIIEGRGCGKNVPMLYDQWIAPSVMGDQEEGVRRLLSEVPCDAAAVQPIERIVGTLSNVFLRRLCGGVRE